MRVVAILLAAGSSRRFESQQGAHKLLVEQKGKPLYRHALDALTASPLIAETIVVVNPAFPLPPEPLNRCRFVVNPGYEEGMGSSLRTGVGAVDPAADAYLIALADMPGMTTGLITSLLERYSKAGKKVLVPVHQRTHGHPVVVSGALKNALLAIQGDVGARSLVHQNPTWVEYFETEDPAVLFDVDTREDLEKMPS